MQKSMFLFICYYFAFFSVFFLLYIFSFPGGFLGGIFLASFFFLSFFFCYIFFFYFVFEVSFPPQHTLHSGMDFNIMLFFFCVHSTHIPNSFQTAAWLTLNGFLFFPFFYFFLFMFRSTFLAWAILCVYCDYDIVCVYVCIYMCFLYLCSDGKIKHFPNIPLLFPIVCAPAADSTYKYTCTHTQCYVYRVKFSPRW